jgi:UDP-N-acetylglucosamine 2-epimerase (non-hydrolysing)
MKKILLVIGTRPEAVKMSPLVAELKGRANVELHVLLTGQHGSMINSVLKDTGIVPDTRLPDVPAGLTLSQLFVHLMNAMEPVMRGASWDWVVVQGDTSSALAGALQGFYHKIKVAHVEAGLRTGDRFAPWPEEVNRCMIAPIAEAHFAPTETSREALLRESIPQARVYLTGNTVVDALHAACRKLDQIGIPDALSPWSDFLAIPGEALLVTTHRRENLDGGISLVCDAILRILAQRPTARVMFPVHLNPLVRDVVVGKLGDHDRVCLLPPMDYLSFVWLMRRSDVILSDSGGVQEEAPGLGKPVVVLRDVTERPEAVTAGFARLVGTDAEKIVASVVGLLGQAPEMRCPPVDHNPFGDGRAAVKIADVLENR